MTTIFPTQPASPSMTASTSTSSVPTLIEPSTPRSQRSASLASSYVPSTPYITRMRPPSKLLFTPRTTSTRFPDSPGTPSPCRVLSYGHGGPPTPISPVRFTSEAHYASEDIACDLFGGPLTPATTTTFAQQQMLTPPASPAKKAAKLPRSPKSFNLAAAAR